MKKKTGRPKKYTKKEEIESKIEEYFKNCDIHNKPYTVTGLSLALNMSRQDLINYSKDKEFFDTIKKAKLKIENYLEEHLVTDSSVTGIIFNLKNNYNWKDKQENVNIQTNYEEYLKRVERR